MVYFWEFLVRIRFLLVMVMILVLVFLDDLQFGDEQADHCERSRLGADQHRTYRWERNVYWPAHHLRSLRVHPCSGACSWSSLISFGLIAELFINLSVFLFWYYWLQLKTSFLLEFDVFFCGELRWFLFWELFCNLGFSIQSILMLF